MIILSSCNAAFSIIYHTLLGAWIISGGTNGGVAKFIGQAVRNHRHTTGSSIVTLGIAPWGILDGGYQQKLIRTEEQV